ncbi:MAG: Tm-1-like ATP-binding domain-containing protein, partial [Acidobacteria bacterium]|nr:Tm-1-like ATP-binding domain-containing protein [Acidobacteriota bacterium]
VTLVRANRDQLVGLAEAMAARLNLATERVAVVIPTGGWSFYNRAGLHFRDEAADQAFVQTLRSRLRSDTPLHELPDHINDPSFAEHLVELFERFWHDEGTDTPSRLLSTRS